MLFQLCEHNAASFGSFHAPQSSSPVPGDPVPSNTCIFLCATTWACRNIPWFSTVRSIPMLTSDGLQHRLLCIWNTLKWNERKGNNRATQPYMGHIGVPMWSVISAWTHAHSCSVLFGLSTKKQSPWLCFIKQYRHNHHLKSWTNFRNRRGKLASFSYDCNIWGLGCTDIFICWLFLPMQKKGYSQFYFRNTKLVAWLHQLRDKSNPHTHMQSVLCPDACNSSPMYLSVWTWQCQMVVWLQASLLEYC